MVSLLSGTFAFCDGSEDHFMNLRIFDFDDTLVSTKCKVTLHLPSGKKKKIATHDFPNWKLNEGESFSFEEFKSIIRPEINKDCFNHFVRILASQMLFPHKKKTIILTARGKEAEKSIKKFLKKMIGVLHEQIEIVCLGDGSADAKVLWIRKNIENADSIVFFDDSKRNREKVSSLQTEFPEKMIVTVDPNPNEDIELKARLLFGMKKMIS